MLRIFVLMVAGLLFTLALVGTVIDPAAWPMLFVSGIFLAGVAFEHVRYKGAQVQPLGPGWRETGERFIDEASGHPVVVWFNPLTGERRYVDLEVNANANELQ